MKELTHYVFSAGASMYVLSVSGRLDLFSVLVVLWLSFLVNFMIDAAGHSGARGFPARTRLTHSIFTAPLWGALLSAASFLAFFDVDRSYPVSGVGLWLALGMLTSVEHLFLDSLTQAGVFYWKQRMAIAHFRYDNPLVNSGFILLGIGLLVLSADGASAVSLIHASNSLISHHIGERGQR